MTQENKIIVKTLVFGTAISFMVGVVAGAIHTIWEG